MLRLILASGLIGLLLIGQGCSGRAQPTTTSVDSMSRPSAAMEAIEQPQPNVSRTETSEESARNMLTTVLDSWVFDESLQTFSEKHPNVTLVDERNSIRPFERQPVHIGNDKANIELLKYEIGPGRQNGKSTDKIDFTYEFKVLMTLQDGERNTLTRSVAYHVSKIKGPEKWFITATVKN